jgi:hypothetical protein
MLRHLRLLEGQTLLSSLCVWTLTLLLLWVTPARSNDVNGDFNTNIQDSTVDSNNPSTTNNYNATGAGSPAPVMSAVSPTMMGGGGNDSCLIPKSAGVQLSVVGISSGGMEQDEACNIRKNARLLGTPQALGGLGLQVSAISVMCASPQVFKAMMLASTPCPIMDVVTGNLVMGQRAIELYRQYPEEFIVGYDSDPYFWNSLLRIGEDLTNEREEQVVATSDTRSLSERFRTTRRDR